MERWENLEISWGKLTKDHKVSRMNNFLLKIMKNANRHKPMVMTAFCKVNGVPTETMMILEKEKKIKQVKPKIWEAYYAEGDIVLKEMSEKAILSVNKYKSDSVRKSQQATRAKKRLEAERVPVTNGTAEKVIESKLKEKGQQTRDAKLVEALQTAVVDTLVKEMQLNIKVNITWNISQG